MTNLEYTLEVLMLGNYDGQTFCSIIESIKSAQAELSDKNDALKSIASTHKKEHETEEYWLNIPHKDCADVLAMDTKIAREALRKWEK